MLEHIKPYASFIPCAASNNTFAMSESQLCSREIQDPKLEKSLIRHKQENKKAECCIKLDAWQAAPQRDKQTGRQTDSKKKNQRKKERKNILSYEHSYYSHWK